MTARKRKKYTTLPGGNSPLLGKRQYKMFAEALAGIEDTSDRVRQGAFIAAVLLNDNPSGFQIETFLKEAGVLK